MIQTREHLFKNCPQWKSQQKTLWATILEKTKQHPGPVRGRDRTKIAELFADERCSRAIMGFLATTDVGKAAGLLVAAAEEEAGSGASEWENREREGHRAQEARLGVGGQFVSFVWGGFFLISFSFARHLNAGSGRRLQLDGSGLRRLIRRGGKSSFIYQS